MSVLRRLRRLLGRPGRSLVFTCPHSACGLPWAETRQASVDVHAGATYRCAECGGQVVFEVLTPAEYVAHCRRLKAEYDAGA